MPGFSTDHEERIKHRLTRLVHVLLTHSPDKSESKEDFCRRCAWTVETIIDDIECPRGREGMVPIGEVLDEVFIARTRILKRIKARRENDWAEVDPHFAAVPETADVDAD